jgi:hypothetical protein
MREQRERERRGRAEGEGEQRERGEKKEEGEEGGGRCEPDNVSNQSKKLTHHHFSKLFYANDDVSLVL